MRKKLLSIVSFVLVSVSSIILLFLFSKKATHQRNAFYRWFPPHLISPINQMALKSNAFYFAGFTSSCLYLANQLRLNTVLVVPYGMKDSFSLDFQMPNDIKCAWNSMTMSVDPPDVFLMEGVMPSILSGSVNDRLIKERKIRNMPHFDKFVRLSKSSFVLRMYDTNLKQNVLIMKCSDSAGISKKYVLEKQVDGIFCTDGILDMDPISKSLVYIYYYRNQFIQFDSNLNLLSKSHTIDTNSWAKIRIAAIASDGIVAMSSPPVKVNGICSVWNNLLFINSKMLANNEALGTDTQLSVIDIYSLKDGGYKFSFYLPHFKGNNIRAFCVRKNILFALCNDYLLEYALDFSGTVLGQAL